MSSAHLHSASSEPTEKRTTTARQTLLAKPAYRWFILLLLLGAALIIRENSLGGLLGSRFQTFVTIFLSIFIEAAPFLLAGSIVSGLIEVAVDKEMLFRFMPRQPILAALAGAALGIVFPVCECGVVPVTRRRGARSPYSRR